jgi:hypothetical protein
VLQQLCTLQCGHTISRRCHPALDDAILALNEREKDVDVVALDDDLEALAQLDSLKSARNARPLDD